MTSGRPVTTILLMGALSRNDVGRKILASEAMSGARSKSFAENMDSQFAQINGHIHEITATIHRIELEIHRVSATIIKLVAAVVIIASMLGLMIMTFVLNNAVPVQTASPSAQIIINVGSTIPAPARLAN